MKRNEGGGGFCGWVMVVCERVALGRGFSRVCMREADVVVVFFASHDRIVSGRCC